MPEPERVYLIVQFTSYTDIRIVGEDEIEGRAWDTAKRLQNQSPPDEELSGPLYVIEARKVLK